VFWGVGNMNKTALTTPVFLTLTLLLANDAPKVFAHTALYNLGFKEGLGLQWDLEHGNGQF